MNTIELDVEGMTCGGCSARLKRVLEATDGVGSARAEHATGQVSVDYDEAVVAVDAIKAAIEDAGFGVKA